MSHCQRQHNSWTPPPRRNGGMPAPLVIAGSVFLFVLALLLAGLVPWRSFGVTGPAAASPQPDVTIPCGNTTLTGPPAEVAETAKLLGCAGGGTVPPPTLVPTRVTSHPTPVVLTGPTPAVVPETGGVIDPMATQKFCKVLQNSNLRRTPEKINGNVAGGLMTGYETAIVAISEDGYWYQLTNGLWIAGGLCEVIEREDAGRSFGSIGETGQMTETIGIRRSEAYTQATYPFDYVPGGNGIGQTADDIKTCPAGLSGCFRWWQAANLENIPWVVGFAGYSSTGPVMALDHPTLWRVAGNGSLKFQIFLDYDEKTAYDVANVKKSQLGLGLFFAGNGASVCLDGQCFDLDGLGTLQAPLPKGWRGYYNVEIHVHDPAGQVNMNIGEKLTTKDNWTPTAR